MTAATNPDNLCEEQIGFRVRLVVNQSGCGRPGRRHGVNETVITLRGAASNPAAQSRERRFRCQCWVCRVQILTGHPPCKFFLAISTVRPRPGVLYPGPQPKLMVKLELLSVSVKSLMFGSLFFPPFVPVTAVLPANHRHNRPCS